MNTITATLTMDLWIHDVESSANILKFNFIFNVFFCFSFNIPSVSFLKVFFNVSIDAFAFVKLRQGSGKEGQGMALKAKGLKA